MGKLKTAPVTACGGPGAGLTKFAQMLLSLPNDVKHRDLLFCGRLRGFSAKNNTRRDGMPLSIHNTLKRDMLDTFAFRSVR